MGDANASIPTPQPRTMRPMFAAYGKALQQSSITFLSQAAIDAGVPAELGLEKVIRPVSGIRSLTKADLKYNGATPEIEVDPETYQVSGRRRGRHLRTLRRAAHGAALLPFLGFQRRQP